MEEPLISVVVTTFNRKDLLKETLDSIINQTYKNIEILVVDNFSEYDFFEHVNSFNDSRITPFQNQNNGIIAVNRNFALKKAKGEYVAFCDDDDIWMPEKLERQLELAFKNENCVVHTDMICFGENIEMYPANGHKINSYSDMIRENNIFLSSTLMTKSNNLIFDEDPLVRAAEDFSLWLNLYNMGYKFCYLPHPMVRYRININSASNDNKKFSYLRFNYVVLKNILSNEITDVSFFLLIKIFILNIIKFSIKK